MPALSPWDHIGRELDAPHPGNDGGGVPTSQKSLTRIAKACHTRITQNPVYTPASCDTRLRFRSNRCVYILKCAVLCTTRRVEPVCLTMTNSRQPSLWGAQPHVSISRTLDVCAALLVIRVAVLRSVCAPVFRAPPGARELPWLQCAPIHVGAWGTAKLPPLLLVDRSSRTEDAAPFTPPLTLPRCHVTTLALAPRGPPGPPPPGVIRLCAHLARRPHRRQPHLQHRGGHAALVSRRAEHAGGAPLHHRDPVRPVLAQ